MRRSYASSSSRQAATEADLPLEASVAWPRWPAVWEGLLAFASVGGLVVMRKMMGAELTERIGAEHA
jgi:hypothetical protein